MTEGPPLDDGVSPAPFEPTSSKPKCIRVKLNGEPCGNWPRKGLTVCGFHGGSTRNAIMAGRRRAELMSIGSRLGLAKDVDPADALLDAVRLAAGDTEYLRVQVQALDDGITKTSPYGDGIHPIVKLYQASLRQQGELAAMAVKAGIEERRVRLAESASVRLAQIIVAVLDAPELALNASQRSRGRELAHRLMTGPPVQVIEHSAS